MSSSFLVGIDVGSTTIKAVVVDTVQNRTIWRDYQRHDSRQPEVLLDFLRRMEQQAGVCVGKTRIFVTGSGGNSLANLIGAKIVQEVNAVSLAVEKLHPEVNSVVELGGQDAKIIIFKEETNGGPKKKIPTMNDKCAGGTGAVIDKIVTKLGIAPEQLRNQPYYGVRLHQVAGKCGVFAETDINSLQKQGVPSEELLASLFDAIVLQNLSVLTRGHTLRPQVLLLGGPNALIRGMREAWIHNILLLWKDRQIQLPAGIRPEDMIWVPADAVYYAALGAVEFGKREEAKTNSYVGTASLVNYVGNGRESKLRNGQPGLVASPKEFLEFKQRYAKTPFQPAAFRPGETVGAFLGVDAGSTSTKAVLLS